MRKLAMLVAATGLMLTVGAGSASASFNGQCDALVDVKCWYLVNGRTEWCDLWVGGLSGQCIIDLIGVGGS